MAVVFKKAKEIATEPLDAGEDKLSVVDVVAQPTCSWFRAPMPTTSGT